MVLNNNIHNNGDLDLKREGALDKTLDADYSLYDSCFDGYLDQRETIQDLEDEESESLVELGLRLLKCNIEIL